MTDREKFFHAGNRGGKSGGNEMTERTDREKIAEMKLGDVVKPWGELCAIGSIQRELYCWFIDRYGAVSMVPRCVVEDMLDATPTTRQG